MRGYRALIEEDLARYGREACDPRHVEAHMRANHGTLDGLSRAEFREAVFNAADDADSMAWDDNEKLADTY